MLSERKVISNEEIPEEPDLDDEFLEEVLETLEQDEPCPICMLPLVKFEDNGVSRKSVCANRHIVTVNLMQTNN